MLTQNLIEAILIEQDAEGLISLGTPQDEYKNEASMIYNRLTNEKLSKEKSINDYIVIIGNVFYQSFGCGTQYKKDKKPRIYFSKDYFTGKKIKQIKIIAKLIFEMGQNQK